MRRSGFGEMSKNVKMGLVGAGVILFIVIIIVMMTKSSFGDLIIGKTDNKPINVRIFPKAGTGRVTMKFNGISTDSFDFPQFNHTVKPIPVTTGVVIDYLLNGKALSFPAIVTYEQLLKASKGKGQACIDITANYSSKFETQTVIKNINSC